jgi:hypothetical protein
MIPAELVHALSKRQHPFRGYCVWEVETEGNDSGWYKKSSCGKAISYLGGNYSFCPFCGKELATIQKISSVTES